MTANKADAIRKLWVKLPDTWDKTRLIADHVGCRTAYVRVVARQRIGLDGRSRFDRAYQASARCRENRRRNEKRRYHNDPAFRQSKLDARRELRRRHKQQETRA